MQIKQIAENELRYMEGKEGLILQGCGGDLSEWINGINEIFTKNGILLGGTKFTHASVFQHNGNTCLLFPFENIKLNIGKLAIWRLQTHAAFGGTWLSDYVPNKLGGFLSRTEHEKPDCPLIGQNGNIFNLVGIASRTLKNHDMADAAKEMQDRVFSSGSYNEALCIIAEYVNITSSEHTAEHSPSVLQRLNNTKPEGIRENKKSVKEPER